MSPQSRQRSPLARKRRLPGPSGAVTARRATDGTWSTFVVLDSGKRVLHAAGFSSRREALAAAADLEAGHG